MRRVVFLALALVLVAGSSARAQPTVPGITVYAAADLDMAFREIKPLFEKATGARVTLVMGSTGNLAKQIEHGAPADVFFAANESFVDDLQTAGAVIPQTRALYAQGRIVLATPTKSTVAVRELLKPKLVYGESIRHTLQFVETGAVEAGIVALSVAGVPDVRYAPIDPKLHKPLSQVAAVVKRSARPELGVAFIQFLNGPEGRPIMKRYGFLLPGEF